MQKFLDWATTPFSKLPWWHTLWVGVFCGSIFGAGLAIMLLANTVCNGR